MDNWEFLYFWATQGLIILISFGFGLAYGKLKKLEDKLYPQNNTQDTPLTPNSKHNSSYTQGEKA